MGISHTAKKLKPLKTLKSLHNSNPFYHPISSTGSYSLSSIRYYSSTFTQNFDFFNSYPNPISSKPTSDFGRLSTGSSSKFHFDAYNGCYRGNTYCCRPVRYFSQSISVKRDRMFWERDNTKVLSEVIEMVSRNGENLEAELEGIRLSVSLIVVIFRALSTKRVSLLRFFEWIRGWRPKYGRNADVCSVIISNCGWLGDYDAMFMLLQEFSSKRITLSRLAFDFVPVVTSRESDTLHSIERLIVLLNKVGGSCRSTGFRSLVEMFSLLGRFDLCKYVIGKSDKRNSYYNIMVKELFQRGDFDGAIDIFEEMKLAGCPPDISLYNNMFSRLCKVRGAAEAHILLEELIKKGFKPDELTYEILICFYCKNDELDCSLKYYEQMVSLGLKPRLSTHAVFIKHYFNRNQYDEAYEYVVSSTDKHKHFGNKLYSVLVNLHRKQQNLVIAHKIVSEMIGRGLRPEFEVYQQLLRHLRELGKENLVVELEAKLCGAVKSGK